MTIGERCSLSPLRLIEAGFRSSKSLCFCSVTTELCVSGWMRNGSSALKSADSIVSWKRKFDTSSNMEQESRPIGNRNRNRNRARGMRKAFCLVSGGIDSTTCLHKAVLDYRPQSMKEDDAFALLYGE